ncbi:MAG TPA: hypothetical protein VMU16_06735 [Candidatus Binataceae bacterium]|nr:hypothetical protein [Candidatus Binataceae bacterium]
MKVLKRKHRLEQTITIRVSDILKRQLDELRERSTIAGFDFNATLREAIAKTARRVSNDLAAIERCQSARSVETISSGLGRAEDGFADELS